MRKNPENFREWKRDIAMAIGTGILAIIISRLIFGCATYEPEIKGGVYAGTLEECNRTAKTLCESIRCENYARASKNRPARELPPSCISGIDGGTDSGIRTTDNPIIRNINDGGH